MQRLTSDQKVFFDTFGYLKFDGLFADRAEQLSDEFERIWTDRGGPGATTASRTPGRSARRSARLWTRANFSARFWTTPSLKAPWRRCPAMTVGRIAQGNVDAITLQIERLFTAYLG